MPQGLIPSLEPFYNAFEQLCKKSQDGVWTGDIYAIRKALASHGVHDRNVTIRLNSLQQRGMLTVATQKLSHKKVIWTVKLNCEVKEMETTVQTGTTATAVPCTVSTDWIGPWIQGIYQERDEALARNRELEAKVTAMAEENLRLRHCAYSIVHDCNEAEKQISELEAALMKVLLREMTGKDIHQAYLAATQHKECSLPWEKISAHSQELYEVMATCLKARMEVSPNGK